MKERPTRVRNGYNARRLLIACWIVATPAFGCRGDGAGTIDTSWIEYPVAERVEQVDVYHGVEVSDPYRWLENETSAETQAWIAAQDEITGRFFDRVPERGEATAYLQDHWLDGAFPSARATTPSISRRWRASRTTCST
jgi:hypothetical protein